MGFGDDGMSVKYGGSNSLTKLLQLIKSRFSVIGHTHTVLGDSTTKTVTVNANGVSECSSTASGINSHAEGYNSTASGRNSHAEGAANTASGVNAHAEGGSTTASDTNAHAEGAYTKATKPASHAEGDSSEAIASNAHAEGYHAKASGDNSHAEGSYTIASTSNSHAEGAGTQASGAQSHAEGGSAKATGPQSHAEGGSTTASGINAHAEGGTTTASGVNAHSEGVFSNATASAAHAEGDHTNAYHDNSHAEGSYTETGCDNQHVAGKYNVATDDMAEVIGNGTGNDARSNARTLDWDGNAWFAGEVTATESVEDENGTVTVEHNLTEKSEKDHAHEILSIGVSLGPSGPVVMPTLYDGTSAKSVYVAADQHTHRASDISEGSLSISHGGTGANTTAGALENLGLPAEGCLPLSGGELFGDLSVGERTGDVNVSVMNGDVAVFEAVVDKELMEFTSASGDGTVGMSMSHNGNYATLTVNFISGSTIICSVVANENNADIRSISRFAANSYSTSYATVSGTNYSDATLVIDPVYVERIRLETDGNAWFAGEVSATEEVTEGGTTTTITHNLTEKADADHTHTILGNDNTKKVVVNANGVSECGSTASGNYSHAEGYYTTASGSNSHAEGYYTTASASGSHAEGYQTEASGGHSHAEGYQSKATSDSSHAEGYQAQATGGYSHAEGFGTKATAQYSHAEGKQSEASGFTASHAEGEQTTASGNNAHSEGRLTVASGKESHAEGYLTYAEGESSHASGTGVVSKSKCQFGMGRYNVATQTIVDTFTGDGSTKAFSTSRIFERIVAVKRDGVETDSYMRNSGNSGITFMSTPASGVEITVEYYPESEHALIIGNGTSDTARSNALAVRWDGLIDIGGTAASDGTSNGDAETCYPVFIRGGWSESSDAMTLPILPCFVYDYSGGGLYYCDEGGSISRVNSEAKIGQTVDSGMYYPITADPVEVGRFSLLLSEAKGLTLKHREFVIAGGVNITLKTEAASGATQYIVSNTLTNRFYASCFNGGRLSVDESSAKEKTVAITSVKFSNGNDVIPYYGATEDNNDIIITVEESLNPNGTLSSVRGYGAWLSGGDVVSVGQGNRVGNLNGAGKLLQVGQGLHCEGRQALMIGNEQYCTSSNSCLIGKELISKMDYSILVGNGHDTSNGKSGVACFGLWSDVTSASSLVVGNGANNGRRSNIFEVRDSSGTTQLIMKSPNQTSYVVTVDNSGNLVSNGKTYLPLSGGTVVGNVRLQAGSTSYIDGLKGARSLYKPHVYNANQWDPCWVVQTKGGGAWGCGNYNDETLEFQYGTKANIDNNNNTTAEIYFTHDRKIYAAQFVTSSDKRLKTHIGEIDEKAVKFIESLHPVKFEMDGNTRVGFYAQDVQEICGDVDMVTEDKRGMLTLDYMQIIAPLVATVQNLTERVEELSDCVEQLEAEIAELKA